MRGMNIAEGGIRTELGIVLGVLAVGAAYQAALALQAIEPRRVPGDTPSRHGGVLLAALLAMLVVGATLPFAAISSDIARRIGSSRLLLLVTVAAVAFVLARYLTFDPYYLPTLRRLSDGGMLPTWWIAAVVLLGIGTAWLARRAPRAGLMTTSGVVVFAAFTALVMSGGH